MDFQIFINQISSQYIKELPFVVFARPESQIVEGLLQKNDRLHNNPNLSEDGFVLAPFDSRQATLQIPENESEKIKITLDLINIEKDRVLVNKDDTAKAEHLKLVTKTIDTIKSGKAKKIVVARRKDLPLRDFALDDLIKRLFSAHPTAFRYIWYHPTTGIWCGATPEILVDINKNRFKTMALAGTQPYTEENVVWRKKELEEQYFVTEAILENLKNYIQDLKIGEVQSHKAGTLLHLKTDILGVMKEEPEILKKIVKSMHPTPAVCGTPKEFSKTFIIGNEGNPREFYTGFVGPITDNATSALLMVNLRCVKIENCIASIFVGGGITRDSNPQEEWKETQNKMQTMLQVLQPML